MTLEALAGSAEIHVTYLSGIELKRRNPSWEKLRPLAETLGVDMSGLVKQAEAIALAEQTTATSRSDP